MSVAALKAHMKSGASNVCRCWSITRADGVFLGFTDHDRGIAFDGMYFEPDAGMTAHAIEQTTGLSVDNTDALGALNDVRLKEEDIIAGRFDGAEVVAWLVNWRAPAERKISFSGTIGEITRKAGAFQAELRGLSEPLNQPGGRVFQKPCSAILGDGKCQVDLEDLNYSATTTVVSAPSFGRFEVVGLEGYPAKWFENGIITVLSGEASGLSQPIRKDEADGARRFVDTTQQFPVPVNVGDQVRLAAGCDRRLSTCANKFQNVINFQGFPYLPGDDWLTAVPRSDGINDGGKRG